jgi:hypothetical protein
MLRGKRSSFDGGRSKSGRAGKAYRDLGNGLAGTEAGQKHGQPGQDGGQGQEQGQGQDIDAFGAVLCALHQIVEARGR